MPDPIRHKNIKEIAMKGTFTEGDKKNDINFSILASQERIEELPEETLKQMLKQDISILSFSPVSTIYSTEIAFKYNDVNALKDFDYGNIFVDVHLPYCLHLPNNYEFEVCIPELNNIKVLLIHRKIWTKKAQEDNIKSSEVDFYAEDKNTYFKTSVIITPKVPIDLDEGWEQNFTGTNIERIQDTNGTFRYSSLYIQFNKDVLVDKLNNKIQLEKIILEIREVVLTAINNLIDNYRNVTRSGYIQRLGTVEINTIYFIDHNQGFYILSSGFGIGTSMMNRSKKDIIKIEESLKKGEKPELYDLLLLDSQTSFDNKNLTLAVVQSFQALEIFLENFLIKEFTNNGKTEIEAIAYIIDGNNWMTKTRLRELLKELKGFSLQDKDHNLWDKWSTTYDTVRTAVIHKGKEPKVSNVKNTLENNLAVIELLKTMI